ncbi:hypothetical protein C0Q44_27900 [Paenibacillus sp. PCH8]|uniref:AAA family ATPase n=1 Tax=Paenibacillus sp. PCH8 TaxID=2066524 RepID=UPI000CF8BDD2|nr:AAA family ATPase [Paenibacillus sp. PCH8]PQP80241.1 hypothetical protein C0Q44_27900 [Paenibacillus sp. PCH8]
MEILYIWFNNYGPFRQQGFQLCGDLRFKYDFNHEVLSVTRNTDYVQDFFRDRMALESETAVVKNITGLIGINGAGKTSLLNYIKRYLVRAMGRKIKEALVVIRNEKDETIILYDKKVINLESVNHEGLLHHIKIYSGTETNQHLPDSSVIYFSNIFDHSHEETATNYYNLSTNYLIQGDYRSRLDLQNGNPKQSPIDVHRDEDLCRQVFFVYDYPIRFPEQELPFRLPKNLVIKIRNIDRDDLGKLGQFANFYLDLNKYVTGKIDEISSRNSDRKYSPNLDRRREIFILTTYRAMIYSFLKEITVFSNLTLLEEDDPNLSLTNVQSEQATFTNYVRNLFNSTLSRFNDDPTIKLWLDNLIFMVDHIYDYSIYLIRTANTPDEYSLKLPIMQGEIMKSPSYDFINVYRRSYTVFPYLDFEWQLSSGQRAFLNVFSRLYSRNDGEVFGDNVKLTKHVLLLIDEGELYFHPEWQRRFIDTLIRFLSVVYGSKRRVQILLTSHSPFILSDLPNYCVSLLQHNDRRTKVKDGTVEFNTLAANIHDLLANGFFMKANIGEFALQKINDAITRLRSLQVHSGVETIRSLSSREEEIDYLRSIIQLVGEPIIAGRMLELLDERDIDME